MIGSSLALQLQRSWERHRDTRHPGDPRRVDSGGWPGSHSYQTEDGGRISPFDYRAVMQYISSHFQVGYH